MSDELSDLKAQAEALGIDIDNRWGEARIRKEIEAHTPQVPTQHPFRVARDYWPADGGERVRKGTIVEMTADDALDGLESGALVRVR
ncbi:hypothetical protein ACLBXM_18830 [Xanthobacteraceae bacterium A53D]